MRKRILYKNYIFLRNAFYLNHKIVQVSAVKQTNPTTLKKERPLTIYSSYNCLS